MVQTLTWLTARWASGVGRQRLYVIHTPIQEVIEGVGFVLSLQAQRTGMEKVMAKAMAKSRSDV